ncbi:hypothetical protein [Eggerthella lenta]|uniref:hypothetical protein n=1 Tax=Eggerthella lenta TaxID=84112 RepID=UPI0013053824|nr:hypothetical protein [Eggerthella lenta]
MFSISDEQATEIALAIYKDVAEWVATRRGGNDARPLHEVEEVEGHEIEDVRSSVS